MAVALRRPGLCLACLSRLSSLLQITQVNSGFVTLYCWLLLVHLQPMSSEEKIKEISKRLGETVERIDSLQKGKAEPFRVRFRRHISKQGNVLVNAGLAGCIFFVAVGRLHQKQEFQVKGRPDLLAE